MRRVTSSAVIFWIPPIGASSRCADPPTSGHDRPNRASLPSSAPSKLATAVQAASALPLRRLLCCQPLRFAEPAPPPGPTASAAHKDAPWRPTTRVAASGTPLQSAPVCCQIFCLASDWLQPSARSMSGGWFAGAGVAADRGARTLPRYPATAIIRRRADAGVASSCSTAMARLATLTVMPAVSARARHVHDAEPGTSVCRCTTPACR